MGLFSKKSKPPSQPLDDSGWLHAGYAEFDKGKSRHYGSPETMAGGGAIAMNKGDVAAAVFYYGKAVDIAQTWLNSRPGERSFGQDETLFSAYSAAVRLAMSAHPDADLVGDSYNENATRSAYYMIQIANSHGEPEQRARLNACIQTIMSATQMSPPETWQG